MRQTGLLFVLAVIVVLVATSCVRLPSPNPVNTQHYLLGNTPPAAPATTTTGLRVGLRKPDLADYLDNRPLVVRRGKNEIHFANLHRWGEDLGPAINRVVGLNLETQPGIESVDVVPWPQGAAFDHVVRLRVLRFEGVGPRPPGPDADDDAPVPEGHSQMTVSWTVFGPEGDSVQARGRTEHRVDGWPVTDYADLTSKLDTSLVVLAEDLREHLSSLSARPPR
jgi:uncharacterized lipoprotein YmbA